MTEIKTNAEIQAQFNNLVYATSDGDIRTAVDAFWTAVHEAYEIGYQKGCEDESAAWEQDLDVVEEFFGYEGDSVDETEVELDETLVD